MYLDLESNPAYQEMKRRTYVFDQVVYYVGELRLKENLLRIQDEESRASDLKEIIDRLSDILAEKH